MSNVILATNTTTNWSDGLFPEQIPPAGHIGSHALLLAGPGTGKTRTITARVLALLLDHKKNPEEILVLTFTRAAAFKLRKDIEGVLKPLGVKNPRISTLHSFALRQLLRNSSKISSLPQPLRIADDWEERYIIWENLKLDLAEHLKTILPGISRPLDKIKQLFQDLSADFETLKFEQYELQGIWRDAKFIGAWTAHREVFGYTLRSELVYQLKKCLDKIPDFTLESKFKYIMVDEYQDLNYCDLAVIEEMEKRGAELFVAGDDDQSIYGFRRADPTGIRLYPVKYKATKFPLETCHRCDKSILAIGEFVANLDYNRLPKNIKPKPDAGEGEVHLWGPRDQFEEADWIAKKCKNLLSSNSENSILMLMRSDDKGKISKPIAEELMKHQVAFAVETEESVLNKEEARKILSIVRLIVDPKDDLGWYSILDLEFGIAPETLAPVRQLAKDTGCRFSDVIEDIANNNVSISSNKLKTKIVEIKQMLHQFKDSQQTFQDQLKEIIMSQVSENEKRAALNSYFDQLISEAEAKSYEDLLTTVSVSLGDKEQELKPGIVNIMTMHKAKGLDADVVFIVGAEKQFIPGENIGAQAEDERRLLYVSLTRARHSLFITCCRDRKKDQFFTGSQAGVSSKRQITPFLENYSLKIERTPSL